jgi:uncharacterized protein (UPF0261 family)
VSSFVLIAPLFLHYRGVVMPIAIVGMLDEREEALRLIKSRIEQNGHEALLMDISIGTGAIVPSIPADVRCGELAELGGGPLTGVAGMLTDQRDRAIAILSNGLTKKLSALQSAGKLEGVIAISGMTGALVALPAMRALPFGLPKLLISSAVALPIHADQFANYFALKDIMVMHAVVDTVGMNALVRTLALNGADAISGMVAGGGGMLGQEQKPSIAITEFGFCDKGAHYIREFLEKEKFEIVSFHAQGLGDRAAMELIPQRLFRAFIDLVPGAFTEYLLGGNRGTAGPDRLDIAARLPIPYIFCPGGFDMISCGPIERKDRNDALWTSRKLADRKLYVQEHPRAQARMNAEELEYVTSAAAERLNGYEHKERVKVLIPTRGFSSLSIEGGALCEPATDKIFSMVLKKCLDPEIEIIEVDTDINSREFAQAITNTLLHIL